MLRDLVSSTPRTFTRFSVNPLSSLRKSMEQLFEEFILDYDETNLSNWIQSMQSFTLKLDLEENDDRIILTAEIPGLTEKDVQVELNKDYLTIKGEKKCSREEKKKDSLLCERSYGSFERSIRIPSDIIKDKINAEVKDGVLTVTLPKSPNAKMDIKKIPIRH